MFTWIIVGTLYMVVLAGILLFTAAAAKVSEDSHSADYPCRAVDELPDYSRWNGAA